MREKQNLEKNLVDIMDRRTNYARSICINIFLMRLQGPAKLLLESQHTYGYYNQPERTYHLG